MFIFVGLLAFQFLLFLRVFLNNPSSLLGHFRVSLLHHFLILKVEGDFGIDRWLRLFLSLLLSLKLSQSLPLLSRSLILLVARLRLFLFFVLLRLLSFLDDIAGSIVVAVDVLIHIEVVKVCKRIGSILGGGVWGASCILEIV